MLTTLSERAVAKTVRGTDHVLDLGCGIGTLGPLCLRAGAAIERTTLADVAKEVFSRAEHGEQSRVPQGNSDRLTLDEAVDLIVCDHVGYFGLDYSILALLQDARSRFLGIEGRIMPLGVDLFLAPVGSDACGKAAFGWSGQDKPSELRRITKHSENHKHAVKLEPENILGKAAKVDSVNFRTETRSIFSWKTEITVTKEGEMQDLSGWFDCTLCEDVKITNSPLVPARINWPQAFFPISKPLHVEKGDVLIVTFVMRPDENLFAWSVEHAPSGWKCRHSAWEGLGISGRDLRNTKPNHVPTLTADAKARTIVLSYCDGLRSIAEIEATVLSEHPDLFPTTGATSKFISRCL